MTTKQVKNTTNITIDSIVARVVGATQVAGAAVSETMAIKDEALDEINRVKTQSGKKNRIQAIKKITVQTKHLRK